MLAGYRGPSGTGQEGSPVLQQLRGKAGRCFWTLVLDLLQNAFSSQQNLEIHRKIKQSEQELAYLERREREVSWDLRPWLCSLV